MMITAITTSWRISLFSRVSFQNIAFAIGRINLFHPHAVVQSAYLKQAGKMAQNAEMVYQRGGSNVAIFT